MHCTCKGRVNARRGEQGPHHAVTCPLWFDPTRFPAHAQQQLDDARTDSEHKKAMLDWDLMIERCD
jgi:hypothetical protein